MLPRNQSKKTRGPQPFSALPRSARRRKTPRFPAVVLSGELPLPL
jgi:hypothetical protein